MIKDDYAKVGIPMAPLVIGERATVIQMVMYAALTILLTVIPFALHAFGLAYFLAALALNVVLALRVRGCSRSCAAAPPSTARVRCRSTSTRCSTSRCCSCRWRSTGCSSPEMAPAGSSPAMEPAAGGRSGWRTLLTPDGWRVTCWRWRSWCRSAPSVPGSSTATRSAASATRSSPGPSGGGTGEPRPGSCEAGEAPRVEGDGAACRSRSTTGACASAGASTRSTSCCAGPSSRDGVPGFHVVTPLVLSDGSAVLVERGWVPQHHDLVPVRAAPPPQGEVTIRAWAFPGETPPVRPAGRTGAARSRRRAAGRRLAYLDLERLAPQMPYALQPLRLVLDAPERAPADVRAAAATRGHPS
jgi:hypothetical protein